MSLEKDLSKLLDAEVISEETAEKIRGFYEGQKSNSSGRMFLAFGILGAVLVGLGIILIIAHNWDELSRSTKTVLAFLPLIVGHLVCLYSLWKKDSSPAWREGSATFLFCAVGASIALISQIYHIKGDFEEYMFTWMLLSIPLVYLMRSSMASLLCIIGVTTYGANSGYDWNSSMPSYYYWLFFSSLLPHYYLLFNKHKNGNFLIFHHWGIPISLTICLGIVSESTEEYMLLAYSGLFGLYYLIGKLDFFKNQTLRNNSYLIMGALGTLFMLIMTSFEDIWKGIYEKTELLSEFYFVPEFYAALLISGVGIYLIMHFKKSNRIDSILPLGLGFLVIIFTFYVEIWLPVAPIIINLTVLTIGIWIVRIGAKIDHLGQLNFGLIIIAVLVTCRFFDTDLSYVLRGTMFLMVGAGFFGTNYWMLKKRRTDEK